MPTKISNTKAWNYDTELLITQKEAQTGAPFCDYELKPIAGIGGFIEHATDTSDLLPHLRRYLQRPSLGDAPTPPELRMALMAVHVAAAYVQGLKRTCPLCNAKPGKECVTTSGKPVQGWRLWENDLSGYVRQPGLHAARMTSND